MIFKLLIPAIIVLAIVILILGVGIFFSKKKRFPDGSISKNPELRKRGLTCAKHDELHPDGKGTCCGGAGKGFGEGGEDKSNQ